MKAASLIINASNKLKGVKDTYLRTKGEFHRMTYWLHFLLLFPWIIIFQICTPVPLSSTTATVSRCCTWAIAYHMENKNNKNQVTPQKHILSNGEVLPGNLNRTWPVPQTSCSHSHPYLKTTMTSNCLLSAELCYLGEKAPPKSICIYYIHIHANDTFHSLTYFSLYNQMRRKRSTQSRTRTRNICSCFMSISGITSCWLGERMKGNISTFIQNKSFYYSARKLFGHFKEIMHYYAIVTPSSNLQQ